LWIRERPIHFGTSITTTLWDDRATLHHAQLTELVSRAPPDATDAFDALGATGLSAQQAARS
jgi:DHA2 family multidrug resistance protein